MVDRLVPLSTSGSSAEQPSPARPKAATPTHDGREQRPADGDHGPERGQRQRGLRRRGTQIRGHVQLRPVAVHGLAYPVQDGETGEQPEPRWDAGLPHRLASSSASRFGAQWQPSAGEEEKAEQDGRQDRKAPPEAEADEDGDEHRCQGGAQPQQGVENEHGPVRVVRLEHGHVRVQHGNGQPEAGTQESGGHQQQRVGHRLVGLDAGRHDQHDHRGDVRGKAEEQLAAGNVTKVMPWTSPARLTTLFSALEAIAAPAARGPD